MNNNIVQNNVQWGGVFTYINTSSFCVPQNTNFKMEFFKIPSFCVGVK